MLDRERRQCGWRRGVAELVEKERKVSDLLHKFICLLDLCYGLQ